MNTPLTQTVVYLATHRRHRNFAEQQTNDLQAELNRIRRLIYIETLVKSITQKLKPNEQEGIDIMRYLISKSGPFTDADQQKFDSLFTQLQHLNNIPGLGITDRERLAIVSALNLDKGHWYVCPKGHPYIITEVGIS